VVCHVNTAVAVILVSPKRRRIPPLVQWHANNIRTVHFRRILLHGGKNCTDRWSAAWIAYRAP
jgi:hypothetical protein